MKKVFSFGALPVVLIAGAGFAVLRKPAVAPPPAIHVEMTPDRIARGKYIFTLANCDGCHSARDWTRFAGPVIETRRGQGVQFPNDPAMGGGIVSANITTDTETGIGAWNDGLKIRAIRDGIGRDGQSLHPIMPSRRFRHMCDEDVFSLVAYLNTLPPVRNPVQRPKASLAASLLDRERRAPAGSVPPPDHRDALQYGKYLATLAGCRNCHTAGSGNPIARVFYGGGRVFRMAGGSVVSPNITPDPHTGIGRWTEADWLDRVYQYREYVEHGSPKVGPESLTVMPWLELSQLDAADLKAIFAWLRSQKPVYRPIVLHPVQ